MQALAYAAGYLLLADAAGFETLLTRRVLKIADAAGYLILAYAAGYEIGQPPLACSTPEHKGRVFAAKGDHEWCAWCLKTPYEIPQISPEMVGIGRIGVFASGIGTSGCGTIGCDNLESPFAALRNAIRGCEAALIAMVA